MARKTTSRLSLIAKGKNIIKSTLREGKIKRAVEAAIAQATEGQLDAEEKALEVLEKMSDTEDLNSVINQYVSLKDEAETWANTKKHLESLKAVLDEQVSVDEE